MTLKGSILYKKEGSTGCVLSHNKVHIMASQPLLTCLVSCLAPVIFGWSRKEWLNLKARRELGGFFSCFIDKEMSLESLHGCLTATRLLATKVTAITQLCG